LDVPHISSPPGARLSDVVIRPIVKTAHVGLNLQRGWKGGIFSTIPERAAPPRTSGKPAPGGIVAQTT
jgi:hypothetical protein